MYAEQLFQNRLYRDAAKKFAESNLTFEEVVLKLVSKANEAGLNIFVEEWLKKLAPEETTQKTMLLSWTTELYVNKLNKTEYKMEQETNSDKSKQLKRLFIL